MRLPGETAGSMVRVTYGRYVWRRLVRAEQDDLANNVSAVTRAVHAAHRAVEDAELPVQEAIADRDADDDDLDETARLVRLQLAARELGADKKRPYTDIFPDGIDYYTGARLSEQGARYTELVAKLESALPATDDLRASTVSKLQSQLSSWKVSEGAVETQRAQLGVARTQRETATEEWTVTLERTYGALVERFGKKKAERFFPRTNRKSAGEGEPSEG
jgi:hypothetical protein